jgi:hypothetical protein
MAKIWLDWSDGRYSTRLLTDEDVATREGMKLDVVYLADSVYEDYLRHCDRDTMWQTLWRAIGNEQAMRHRERELIPLEEAAREIDQLKEQLARAKRMEAFYEERYEHQLGERRHARAHEIPTEHKSEEFTCIFPQPGCDVQALPTEWRERAAEILEKYNVTWATEGIKVQGCCCGNAHKKLDDDASAQLRDAGFIVEHDAESAPVERVARHEHDHTRHRNPPAY